MTESLSRPIDLPPSRTVGRYELLGGLGRGGMATVYLGRSEGEAGFQRLFAIKVLHPHLADDEGFRDMLLDEARIAARLHHPNVVPIVDLGSDDGRFYVVMEYVEGCSLHALLSKHREARPPRLIIPIVLDALAGLHAAHALVDDDLKPMNLVHRDVSPQNVLVGIEGTARITDFGVARAESRIISTRPGEVKGKVSYMSPEQIRGGTLDARSDVFASGVMLWCAVTGRRLFSGDGDAATMTNILQMEVPPPSTMGFKPPAVFDAICLRALEKDPAKRWGSALEMEEALREAATASGLLGSRREVAEWVKSTFETELSARHSAIRSVGRVASGRAPRSAADSSSGFRMIPNVGGGLSPDADAAGLTPSAARVPPPGVGVAPAAEPRRTVLLATVGAAVLVTAVFATWAATRGPAPTQPVPLSTASTQAAVIPTTVAQVATVEPRSANAATSTATSTATVQAKPLTAFTGVALHTPRPQASATGAAPAVSTTSPPTATNTGPKPAWDPDSRLPPP